MRPDLLKRVLRGPALAAVVLFFLFPIFWILLMSFQTNTHILRMPAASVLCADASKTISL